MANSNTQKIEMLQKEIANLQSLHANLYLPKHFENMMTKISVIEESARKSQSNITTCYAALVFVFLMFTVLALGVVYCIYRLNQFKFNLIPRLYQDNWPSKRLRSRQYRRRVRAGKTIPLEILQEEQSFSAPEIVVER